MSKIITNPKNYTGDELSAIFFRPILSGASATSLGIRVLYNMPVPTTVGLWQGATDVLTSYSKGWQGDNKTSRFQKSLTMKRVKAEMSYSASDYFSMVYERLLADSSDGLGDLSGTALESAETAIFRQSIAEALRLTMWLGDNTRASGYNTFDGILKHIKADCGTDANSITKVAMTAMTTDGNADKLFAALVKSADARLMALKSSGGLVLLATRDVIENYENSLYSGTGDSARAARINGIDHLNFRGIEVVDMGIDGALAGLADLPKSFAILTDRRNLVLAVNTKDLPGSEVSMWYNPDELENRQRAVFLAGADYLLPELVVASF